MKTIKILDNVNGFVVHVTYDPSFKLTYGDAIFLATGHGRNTTHRRRLEDLLRRQLIGVVRNDVGYKALMAKPLPGSSK